MPIVVKGTGGVASTGGISGTGGVTASGGRTSTGGVTGTGGMATSTGGASGSAGGAPGGADGKPGPGGGGGNGKDQAMCATLSAQYDDAVSAAKSCDANPKAATKACAKAVPASLSGCGAACTTFVDDDAKPKMIQQQWMKAGCTADSCTTILCVSPLGASCVSTTNDKGTCTDSLLGI